MDPNVAYNKWTQALLEENKDDACEAFEDLCNWIAAGGFEPSWTSAARKQFFTFNPETGMIE